MKAAINEIYGPPAVLQIKEVEKPVPKDNEVLIRVYATTVNRTDCAVLQAKPFIMRFFTGLLKPKITIQGTDFAGEIETIGKDVEEFNVGDKVFGFDDLGLSSHAEYISLAYNHALAIIPSNTSFAQAAASLEGFHYAYNFFNKLEIKNGQKVLVNGASGAIGSATVQLLKYFNADVTAVCSTKNIEIVRSIGADKIIDYQKEDFTQIKEKFSCVLDSVGKSSFNKCKPLLETGGIYISSELGWMAQNLFYALFSPLMGKKKLIFPYPHDCKRTVLFIRKLIEKGKFQAVIDREYSLDNIAEAYSYVLGGEKTGNVIIKIED
jgi:NADPH:quinone reductase-like Zn-dependent oxidoreductase